MNNFIFPFNQVKKNSTIVLYGAGNVGQCFYKQLITTQYCSIKAWVDKNHEAYSALGLPIKSIEFLSLIDRLDYIVISIDDIDTRKNVYEYILSNFTNISHKQIIYEGNYSFPDKGILECTQEELFSLKLLSCREQEKNSLAEEKYNFNSLKNRRFYNGSPIKKICTVEIPIRDLVLAQYRNWNFSSYQHCDMAVRMFAYEEICGENSWGLDLYRRMQILSGFDWSDRYKKLISSVELKGLDTSNKIELDRNLMIMDGSHRTTLAYIKGIDFIWADVYDCDRDRNFGMDFFWENGFLKEECYCIEKKQSDILNNCKYEYWGVIWPPAYHIADEITDLIANYDPQNIKLCLQEDTSYDKDDFYYLFKALYYPDVIDDAGIEQKFSQIENCMGESGVYNVRFIKLTINNPMICVNEKNHMPQSLNVKRLKKIVRGRLNHKIDNYEYDVMIHIADNFYQSRFIEELLTINRDVSDIIEVINRFEYVAIKMYGRQHRLFPYYYWGDFDVLVKDEDIERFALCIETYLCNKYRASWKRVENRVLEDGSIIVWLKIKDLEIFGVHIQTVRRFGMNYEYNRFMIEKGQINENGIFCLPPEYDVYIRMAEFLRKPYKKHHKEYVNNNIKYISEDLVNKFWSNNCVFKNEIFDFLFGEGINK